MPEYRHPRADPETDSAWAADLGDGTVVDVDSDGVFSAESDGAVRRIAAAYDTTPDEMRVDDEPETCQTVKADGEVCGRELPCPYHSQGSD